jgi:hypothetical protein
MLLTVLILWKEKSYYTETDKMFENLGGGGGNSNIRLYKIRVTLQCMELR